MTTPDQLEREIAEKACEIIINNRVESCDCDVCAAETVFGPAPTPDEFIDSPLMQAALRVFRKELREVAEKAFDAGYQRCCWEEGIFKYKNNYPSKQEWLKENNLL